MSAQNETLQAISKIDLDPIFQPDLRKQLVNVGKAASKLPAVLTTAQEVQAAEEVLRTGKQFIKQAEEARKSFTRPLDEKKADLMTLERAVAKPAADAVASLTKAINAYHAEEQRKAREEQARLRQEEEARLRRLRSPASIAAVQQQTEAAIAAVAAPTAGTRKVKKYRVVDLNQVPRELLMIDDSKIQNMMKQGISSCAGLEIYEEVVRSGR